MFWEDQHLYKNWEWVSVCVRVISWISDHSVAPSRLPAEWLQVESPWCSPSKQPGKTVIHYQRVNSMHSITNKRWKKHEDKNVLPWKNKSFVLECNMVHMFDSYSLENTIDQTSLWHSFNMLTLKFIHTLPIRLLMSKHSFIFQILR